MDNPVRPAPLVATEPRGLDEQSQFSNVAATRRPFRRAARAMRLLVVSDLHANWPALEAVLAAEAFDRLVVLGDLVSYGPHPREVVELVQSRASVAVKGNHDEAMARGIECGCAPSSKLLADATQAAHRALLSPADRLFLESLPGSATFEEGGRTYFAVHASPRDHLYRYTITPEVPETALAEELEPVSADYVLLGHTHLPMVRRVGSRVVVNPGSVGQPRDGDPRAGYAVIEDGLATLKRVAYDVDRTVRGLRELPLPPEVRVRLITLLRSGRA